MTDKEENIFLRSRAREIIIEFMKWYLSGTDYQDERYNEEAKKYADDFLSAYLETKTNNTVDNAIIECCDNIDLKAQIEKMKSDVQELSNNKYYYLSQDTCKELLRRWN